ncbi:MAG: hypothetical protein RSE00_03490 [Clostridia bacterium]
MGVFSFLFIIFVLLIVITIVSTIIKISFIILTNYNYESKTLFIPALLTIFEWCAIFASWFYTLSCILKINLLNLIFNIFIIKGAPKENILEILIISIIFFVAGILIQTFTYYSVNINYKKIFGNARIALKKMFNIKQENSDTKQDEVVIGYRTKKVSLSTSFIASIFSFSLIFFCVFILLTIGQVLSAKLL